jgi:hypothetical protein
MPFLYINNAGPAIRRTFWRMRRPHGMNVE